MIFVYATKIIQKQIIKPSVFRTMLMFMVVATCFLIGSVANAMTNSRTVTICPFCSAIALTFSEQLNESDIAVVAELVKVPPPMEDDDEDFPKADFKILKILKGKKFVAEGMSFNTQLVGNYDAGQKFLILGVEPPKVAWSTPMKASDRVFKYLSDIQELPETGPERLIFFQDYFEDKETVLAFDAYDEFARAPYEDLIAMKDQMDHDQLIKWIEDPDTSVNRRRLYFTMLGVCGKKEDIKLLEELITADSRKKRAGLDALIACYLNLKGEEGVALVEKTFIINEDADYVDTLATVSALRFHGTEVEFVSKKRIVQAIRHLLDKPKMADMIIPDLARWKDWSVMERLVTMFKEADPESNWLRVPVITYLRACPKPEAKTYIAELQKIDPEAVERADFFLGFDNEDEEGWGDEEETIEEDITENKNEPAEKTGKSEKETELIPTESKKQSDNSDQEEQSEKFVVRKVPVDQQPELVGSAQDTGTFATVKESEQTAEQIPAKTEAINSDKTETNPELAVFVSSPSDSMSAQAPPVAVATPAPTPQPVVVAKTPTNLTVGIIFIPMAISVLIFLLLWSVVNGWFERLIF